MAGSSALHGGAQSKKKKGKPNISANKNRTNNSLETHLINRVLPVSIKVRSGLCERPSRMASAAMPRVSESEASCGSALAQYHHDNIVEVKSGEDWKGKKEG
jgi:hypothetical protein